MATQPEQQRVFRRTPQFKKSFELLDGQEQTAAKKAYHEIFRHNPFDARLETHKINRLSSLLKRVVFGAKVTKKLCVVFYTEGNTVFSFNIGDHSIYG